MENSFSKRFKSSMKISKNHSIFDNLVPIDKSIKLNQVHNDESFNSLNEKNYGKKVQLDYGIFLPPIATPENVRSRKRITRRSRKSPFYDSFERKDLVLEVASKSKSNSPVSIRDKIESDIRRILKSVERADELLGRELNNAAGRITRKKKCN
jgi:hypothetical protein